MSQTTTTKILRECLVCRASFLVYRCYLKRGGGKFCSQPCHIKYCNSRSIEDRFWEKVSKGEGCWLWTDKVHNTGYGRLGTGRHKSKMTPAHRIAWEVASGAPVPDGLFVAHVCDVRRCVRNDDHGTYEVNGVILERRGHLFLSRGTLDNNRDAKQKGRTAKGERHGLKLHPERVARGDRSGARTHPERLPRGDNHPWRLRPELVKHGTQIKGAKLTEDKVAEMRRLYASGAGSYEAMGALFGVSGSVAGRAIVRSTWKHVP